MGESQENVQIELTFDDAILLLTGIMAEVRPLLQDERLDFEKGLILFCEDNTICSKVWRFFKDAGNELCKSLRRSEWKIPNNKIGIHIYNQYDKEMEAFEFFQNDLFTPIIVVCGMIPECLKRNTNLIVFENVMNMQQSETLQVLRDFCEYVHANPTLLQRQLRLCKSSDFFQQSHENPLYISMETAAEIFCCYYRESHDEVRTRQQRLFFHHAIIHHLELAECYTEDLESVDLIRKVIENYIDGNSVVQIGKVSEIDGELTKAVEREAAILYDEKFYYIPEKILRYACEPFQNVASVLSVKRALLESGFLCCNDGREGNFTVKKLLTNVYGHSFRLRFLKIRKEFFLSDNSLGLEERRQKCTSEILMENHVG